MFLVGGKSSQTGGSVVFQSGSPYTTGTSYTMGYVVFSSAFGTKSIIIKTSVGFSSDRLSNYELVGFEINGGTCPNLSLEAGTMGQTITFTLLRTTTSCAAGTPPAANSIRITVTATSRYFELTAGSIASPASVTLVYTTSNGWLAVRSAATITAG